MILGSLAFLLIVPAGLAVWQHVSRDRLVVAAVRDALGSDPVAAVRIRSWQRLRDTDEERLFRMYRICGVVGEPQRPFGALIYRRRSGFLSERRVRQISIEPARHRADEALLKDCEG